MTGRNSVRSHETDHTLEPPDTAFRLAFGGYVGVLVAGLVTAVAAVADASSIAVTGTYVAGFLGGCLVGVVLARRIRGLAIRIGETRRRRAAVVLLAVPFGIAAVASLAVPLEPRFRVVSLGSGIAVAIVGSLVGSMARTGYVDAVTGDEPVATWRWEPPSSPKLDAFVLVMWLLLGVVNASGGNWTAAFVWIGLAIFWGLGGIAEGRWRVGSVGATPEIRVHDVGLVRQRLFTRSLVSWADVSHVRLREGELVLDRGLFDVRFDRDELPDLEAARTAIERRLPNSVPNAAAE